MERLYNLGFGIYEFEDFQGVKYLGGFGDLKEPRILRNAERTGAELAKLSSTG